MARTLRHGLPAAALIGLCGAVVIGPPGCKSGGKGSGDFEVDPPPRPSTDGSDVAEGEWPFWPTRMRIHPLTQLVTDRRTGERLIEVRIEFLDAYNHTCKAVGQVDLELHAADDPAPVSQPIERWDTNLANLAANHDHYDEVTRTYLFRLEVEQGKLPQEIELRAFFWSGDEHLQARYRMTR